MGLITFAITYILAYVVKRCKDKGLLKRLNTKRQAVNTIFTLYKKMIKPFK